MGWILWYEDTFDRETPRSKDASGPRLVDGLRVLWRKTLREGLTDSGGEGFARFLLTWGEGGIRETARIETYPPKPLAPLRRWVEEDPALLDLLADTHQRLIDGYRPGAERVSGRDESDAITAAATGAENPEDLASRLAKLTLP